MFYQRLATIFKAIRRSPSASSLLLVCALTLVAFLPLRAVLGSQRVSEVGFVAVALAFLSIVIGTVAMWWLVARPFEAALRESRRTLRSLFVENPESIAVYNLEGCIVAGNKAAADMMQQPPEALIGAHFTEHVAPELMGEAHAAFHRAVEGGTVAFETVFVGRDSERIDVRSTVFPRVVDGRVAGVFGVAKDIGDLKRANAAYREQSQRIGELYHVAASSGHSWKQQIDEALALACRRLGYDGAFLLEVIESETALIAQAGAATFIDGALPFSVAELRAVIASPEVVVDGARSAAPAAFAGAAVRFGKSAAGVLGLYSLEPRGGSLDVPDQDFIRLVAALAASAIERGRQEERLDQLAFFDSLTGLPNRVMVSDRLAEMIGAPKWRGKPFAVHYIDLDRFKQVNDGFGHGIGDRLLRLAARRMQDCISASDMVARLGGDEFVVVQPLLDEHTDAKGLASSILAAIGEPFRIDDVDHHIGVSIGISISPNNGSDSQTLLQRADEALYRAKRDGRNRLQFALEPEGAAQHAALDQASAPAADGVSADRARIMRAL